MEVYEINGLYLIENVFTEDEEKNILSQIDLDKNKNICHQIHTAIEYGWKFIPMVKRIKKDHLGSFPEWLQFVWYKCITHEFFPNYALKSNFDYPTMFY